MDQGVGEKLKTLDSVCNSICGYMDRFISVWKKKIKEEYHILGGSNECVRRATFWRNMEEGKLKVCFGTIKIVVLFGHSYRNARYMIRLLPLELREFQLETTWESSAYM